MPLSAEQRRLAQRMLASFKGRRTLFGVRQRYLGTGEFQLSGEDVRKVYHALDTTGDGQLDHEEFCTALDRLGLGLRVDQSEELLRGIDSDGSNTIGYEEFAEVVCLGQNLSAAETTKILAAPPIEKPRARRKSTMRRMSVQQRERTFAAAKTDERRQKYTARELCTILRNERRARARNTARRERRLQAEREMRTEAELAWLRKRKPRAFVRMDSDRSRTRELRQWFDFLDLDSSGEISVDELEDPLLSMGFASSRAQVEALIASVDKDGSGEIGFEEFLEIVTSAETKDGKPNPIVSLYTALADGELGDNDLALPSVITAYRRRVMLGALLSHGADPDKEGGGTACAARAAARERDLSFRAAVDALDMNRSSKNMSRRESKQIHTANMDELRKMRVTKATRAKQRLDALHKLATRRLQDDAHLKRARQHLPQVIASPPKRVLAVDLLQTIDGA